MSLHRYAAKRDANEREIISALLAVGAQVHQQSRPDLLVFYRERLYLLEVKDPAQPPSKRRLTPLEEEFHSRFPVSIVLTPSDALGAIKAT